WLIATNQKGMPLNDPTADLTLMVQRSFKASPERMFRTWTEPEAIQRWFGGEGQRTVSAAVDLRGGGAYRYLTQNTDGNTYFVGGMDEEIQPPSRLVFTWVWEDRIGNAQSNAMLVTVEFVAEGDMTQVVLTQEHIPDQGSFESHQHGWKGCLDHLEKAL